MIKNIKRIICHDKCSDGSASAMILHYCFPDASVEFVSHGPQKDALEPTEGMLWCDICPDAAHAQKFIDAGAYVLDHHKGMKEVVLKFGDHGFFADEKIDPGISGASLAYSNCWTGASESIDWKWNPWPGTYNFNEMIQLFAKVTGVYDNWQKNSPLWADALLQAKALQLYGNEKLQGMGLYNFLHDRQVWSAMAEVVQHKENSDVADLAKHGYFYTTDTGYRIAVFPSTQLINGLSEATKDQADIVMGFNFEANNSLPYIKLSMRLTKDLPNFSAHEFMAELGGGGHTKAAGAMIPLKTYSNHPYQYIYDLTYFL